MSIGLKKYWKEEEDRLLVFLTLNQKLDPILKRWFQLQKGNCRLHFRESREINELPAT